MKTNRLKLFIPLILFIVIGAFLMVGLKLDPSHLPSALLDKPVPEFELKILGEDRTITNEDLVGEPFLLNVWATWCPTCRVENPYLVKLSKQGVKIVGVNYKDQDQPALDWLKRFGNPFAFSVVDSDGAFGFDLGVYGAPETFIVDSKGIIKLRHVGVVDEKVWRSEMAPLML